MSPITDTLSSADLQAEIDSLLAQPFVAGERVDRGGDILNLTIRPTKHEADSTVDLSVFVVTRHLSPPAQDESEADQFALQAFLEGLQDADEHIRLAACEALGQLGAASARQALEAIVAHDESMDVRDAAAQAIMALEAPRVRQEDLAGIRLCLWRQHQHLLASLAVATTDRRGHACFFDVPAGAICRLDQLDAVTGGVVKTPALRSARRAAAGVGAATSSLPRWQELAMEGGSLLCTLYLKGNQVMLQFNSDAPRLQGGGVRFTATNRETGVEALSKVVTLEPARHGTSTWEFPLNDLLDLRYEYAIEFEPLPVPQSTPE